MMHALYADMDMFEMHVCALLVMSSRWWHRQGARNVMFVHK